MGYEELDCRSKRAPWQVWEIVLQIAGLLAIATLLISAAAVGVLQTVGRERTTDCREVRQELGRESSSAGRR